MNILPNSYLTDTIGASRFNNALGIVNLFRGFSCFLGTFIGGKIGEGLGTPLYSFYFSAAMFGAGAVFSLICGIYGNLKACCNKDEKATEDELDALKAGKA